MPVAWVERLCRHWLERFRSRQGLHRTQNAKVISDKGAAFPWETAVGQRSFLHLGCGGVSKQHTAPGFSGDDWHEIRLHRDAVVVQGIVAGQLMEQVRVFLPVQE
jgi:hypothetical protein